MKTEKKTYEAPKYEVVKFDEEILTWKGRFQSGCNGQVGNDLDFSTGIYTCVNEQVNIEEGPLPHFNLIFD